MEDEYQEESHQNSLEFYVTCSTNLGEELRICGNSIQTGNWNPFSGHKLITDPSIYPKWKSYVPLIIRNNLKLQFKACIVSQNKVIWEKSIPNRQILTEHPSILQFVFNEPIIKITTKKVREIDCRQGTFQIIHQMQSSEASSLEFKANYPLEYFFQTQEQKNQQNNLKYSDGELSSNLFSQNAINISGGSRQKLQYERQFEQVIVNYVAQPQLIKTHSIRPSVRPIQMQRRSNQNRNQLQPRDPRSVRQNSKSMKRSESSSKSKKQEPATPVFVHIPKHSKRQNQPKEKSRTMKLIAFPQQKNNESTSTQQYQTQENRSNKSNSTQFETEREFLETRDQDVIIQGPQSQYGDI